MTLRKPSLGTVLGATALTVALVSSGGVAEAAKLINGKLIKPNTVTSKQIKDGTITSTDLAPGVRTTGPAGPRGSDGAPGAPGAPGVPGAAGSSLASGKVAGADGSLDMAVTRVDGELLACGGCSPLRRVNVTRTGVGSYCLTVEARATTGSAWAPYASAESHVAVVSPNSGLTATAKQWLRCNNNTGYDIRTSDAGGSADVTFNFVIN